MPLSLSYEDNLLIKYLVILGFWIFGIKYIFTFIYDIFSRFNIHYSNFSTEHSVTIIAFFTGIVLWVSFQITFSCLITPFLLICLIYHKLFEKFLIFFGIEVRY